MKYNNITEKIKKLTFGGFSGNLRFVLKNLFLFIFRHQCYQLTNIYSNSYVGMISIVHYPSPFSFQVLFVFAWTLTTNLDANAKNEMTRSSTKCSLPKVRISKYCLYIYSSKIVEKLEK